MSCIVHLDESSPHIWGKVTKGSNHQAVRGVITPGNKLNAGFRVEWLNNGGSRREFCCWSVLSTWTPTRTETAAVELSSRRKEGREEGREASESKTQRLNIERQHERRRGREDTEDRRKGSEDETESRGVKERRGGVESFQLLAHMKPSRFLRELVSLSTVICQVRSHLTWQAWKVRRGTVCLLSFCQQEDPQCLCCWYSCADSCLHLHSKTLSLWAMAHSQHKPIHTEELATLQVWIWSHSCCPGVSTCWCREIRPCR